MKFKKTPRGWCVDFYHPLTRQRMRKVFPAQTLHEAKQMFEVQRAKMLKAGGLLPSMPQNSPLLSVAIKEYFAECSKLYKSESSQVTDKTALNGFFAVAGDVSVYQLSVSNVLGYIRHEREDLHHQASTINRRLNTIKHFLGWCFARSWLIVDIAKGIKHVKGPSRECRALSNEELDKIFEHATDTLRLQIQISATWGLRAGEVAALEWSWFNFEENRVSIGKTTSFATKSGRSKTLPIPSRLKEVLLEQRKISGKSKWVFSNQWGTGAIKSHVISTAWRRAWLASGLEYIRFHDLRATVATRLAESGFGDAGVARVLGQSSQSMARHYSKDVVAPIAGGINGIEKGLSATVLGQDLGRILPNAEMATA